VGGAAKKHGVTDRRWTGSGESTALIALTPDGLQGDAANLAAEERIRHQFAGVV
jgi:hypothetical protein